MLKGVVKAMDAAMKSMNLEKISTLMDKFEQQFEDLDVHSNVMENAMSQTTTTTVPQGEVDGLMQQVADEAGYVTFQFLCVQEVKNYRILITRTSIKFEFTCR